MFALFMTVCLINVCDSLIMGSTERFNLCIDCRHTLIQPLTSPPSITPSPSHPLVFLSYSAAKNCSYFKHFTSGEEAEVFEVKTQKGECLHSGIRTPVFISPDWLSVTREKPFLKKESCLFFLFDITRKRLNIPRIRWEINLFQYPLICIFSSSSHV